MLKSNKGYNLLSNAKKKLPGKFTQIMSIFLIATTLAVSPAVLSSCAEENAIHQTMSSVSVKEMSAFVKEYLRFPAIGNMCNSSSIAYSVEVEDGKVYKIDMITTTEEPNGQTSVLFTTLDYKQGLSAREIEKKQNLYNSSFSNIAVKTFEAGEEVELEDIYSEYLGSDYVVAKEYSKSADNEIEI